MTATLADVQAALAAEPAKLWLCALPEGHGAPWAAAFGFDGAFAKLFLLREQPGAAADPLGSALFNLKAAGAKVPRALAFAGQSMAPAERLGFVAALPEAAGDALARAAASSVARDHAERFGPGRARPFKAGSSAIPPSGKVIGADEVDALVQASLDGWLTAGRHNESFERRLAALFGRPRSLTVNSGSSANLVALSALTSPKLGERALKAGDEVITAACGFPTTVNPISQNNLLPVFVDSGLDGNIDAAAIEQAIGPRTRAIMAAHTLGNPMRMDLIMDIARRRNLWVVEDCCDALGASFGGQAVGTFGDIATLSFYPAHHITMGEGGSVIPASEELAVIAESFRDWGRDCWCAPGRDNTCGKRFCHKLGDLPAGYDHKYTYSHMGYNLKAGDLQAACGLAQLDRLEGFVAARRSNHATLNAMLADLGLGERLNLPQATPGSDPSWFGFLLSIREGEQLSRDDLTAHLEAAGVGTRLLFGGNITRQPYFQGRPWRSVGAHPGADFLMRSAFWIGVWPGLGESELAHMAETIGSFFGARW